MSTTTDTTTTAIPSRREIAALFSGPANAGLRDRLRAAAGDPAMLLGITRTVALSAAARRQIEEWAAQAAQADCMRLFGGIRYRAATPPAAVLAGRWDVPGRYQGQIVEVAFAAEGPGESGPGALWARVSDASDRSVAYYRRVGARWPRR